jgi:type II secretion system protein N
MAPRLPFRLPNLGPRARKVLHYVGFAALGLVTFVFALQMTFPFHRVKDKVTELLSEKYEVTIGSIERGFVPGRMYVNAMSLRSRPAKADEVATTFFIEQLEVDLGLLALLRGAAAVDFDAKIGSAHLTGDIALSKDATSIELAGDDLPSASLPMRDVLGLPMSGKVRLAFNLDLPNEKTKTGKVAPNWVKAKGSAAFACPSGCTIGDGKSKLRLTTKDARSQAFLDKGGGGIDFGKVNIDSLQANLEIKNGKMAITKFETKSGDGELHIDFEMALKEDLNQSQVTGCLRFNGSAALQRREPKTHAAMSTTGGPLGPDNLFHIKLEGPLRQVRRLPQLCGPGAGASTNNPGAPAPRPNLTVTPEPPVNPAGAGTIPPPQPLPPAAPPVTEVTPPSAPPPTIDPAGGVMQTGSPNGENGEVAVPRPIPPLPEPPPTPPPPTNVVPPPPGPYDPSMQPPPGVGQ